LPKICEIFMNPEKTTIMIGLLGDKPKMGKKEEGGLLAEDMSSCPLSTMDADINKGNMKKAVITASYGEVEDGEGKCKACEYFNTDMADCGVPKGKGHCDIFDFVCDQNNGCMAFCPMGEDDMEMEDEEYED
jgi:hypothetical protein